MLLTLEPIGIIRTPYTDRYDAPRQPGAAALAAEGTIELAPGRNFEQALADLEGFERIWLLFWFHRNTTWKPKVLPPRGDGVRRGLFSTRSPHRPNPLGLSLVRLVEVRGRTVRVADVDLLDGTPILDIKPYLPYAEAFPDAGAGWLDAAEAQSERAPVIWTRAAAERAAWLEKRGVHLTAHVDEVLGATQSAHPYRRIRERTDGTMELAVRSWRVLFRVESGSVIVATIESGYARDVLEADHAGHDAATHNAYHDAFGD